MDVKPVLCLLWAGGKLGAAYFDLENSELFLLTDTPENPLDFEIVKLIYRQLEPSIILLNSRQDQRLVSLVTELTKVDDVETETGGSPETGRGTHSSSGSRSSCDTPRASMGSSEENMLNGIKPSEEDESFFSPRSVHSPGTCSSWDVQLGEIDSPEAGRRGSKNCQLITLPAKDFAPDPCKARVKEQRLPREQESVGSSSHLIFISSLISFKNILMVRAAGALLSFMDKNGMSLFRMRTDDGRVHVEDIKLFQLNDLVLVDDTAWSSLQIFNVEDHPATAKKGGFRSTKEGLSVYRLLDRCLTIQGSKLLKTMLLRPTRNLQTLNRRFDVIDFCSNPLHMEYVKNACECLKAIKSWPNLISKIEALHASVNDWHDLYQTIYHFVLMADVTSRQSNSIELFREICVFDRIRRLRTVAETMCRTIDFTESKSSKRFIPKAGINPVLDRTRKQYSCLPKIMSKVAEQEINLLPSYIVQCSVVYFPEIGYLLAVNYWDDHLKPEELQIPGLDYKFSNYRVAYYKSKRTLELDDVLGDYQVAMVEQETNNMLTLTETIMVEKTALMEMGSLISELDCLIAMSKAACEYNFVRPTIVSSDECLEIKDGKHPLVGLANFVPNSTLFAGLERIVILTGPNASGKSIYLKQVGIIVMMALSGSFVPACSARIPAFNRICTKIHLLESVSFGLSTFLIDLNQMAFALRESTKSSLIIIDEFGKGTAETDGLSLLIASLNELIRRGSDCPTVFLSTHYYSLMNYMDQSRLLKFQTMQFVKENNDIIYLYKLIDGMSKKSFASVTALQAGVSEAVVERFEKLHDIIIRNESDLEELKFPPTPKQAAMIKLAEEFMTLDLDAIDPIKYVTRIMETLKPFRTEEEKAALDHREPLENFPISTPASMSSIDADEASTYFPISSFNNTSSSTFNANLPSASIVSDMSYQSNGTTNYRSDEDDGELPSKRRLVSYEVESSQSPQNNVRFQFPNSKEPSETSDSDLPLENLGQFRTPTPGRSDGNDRDTISEYLDGRSTTGSLTSYASTLHPPIPRGATLLSPNSDDFNCGYTYLPASVESATPRIVSSTPESPEYQYSVGARDDLTEMDSPQDERSFISSPVQNREVFATENLFANWGQSLNHDPNINFSEHNFELSD